MTGEREIIPLHESERTHVNHAGQDSWRSTIIGYLRSTSKRDFIVIPILVLIEQVISRRRIRVLGIPLMAWGYLQYRLAGNYRARLGGGGPGVSGPPPSKLVTTGIYSLTRNPMYSGHIIFLIGLAISTGSPIAIATSIGVVPWFRGRVIRDEHHMRDLFGLEFDSYLTEVGRWGPKVFGTPMKPVLDQQAEGAT